MGITKKNVSFTLVAFLAGCLCTYLWISHNPSHQKPVSAGLTDQPEEIEVTPVFLYFANREETHLNSEKRVLQKNNDLNLFATRIIKLLIDGPEKNYVKTLPGGTKLNALYLLDDGTACVDFSHELKKHHPGGIQTEYLTVYSIVNTLVLNIPEIRQVKLLIGNNEAETLAGHIDIRYPLKANMLLIR